MSQQNVSAPLSTEGLPLTNAYDSGSGTSVMVAAGTVSTDANHNSQRSAPAQVQVAAGAALVGVIELADAGGTNKATIDAQGAILVSSGGKSAVSVASATPGAVKASAGRLCRVIITTLGTGSQVFYDNASAASGTILFATAASAAVGTIYDVQAPAANGIYAAGAASTPVCTVLYN